MGSACRAGSGVRVTAELKGCRGEHFGGVRNLAWGRLGEGQELRKGGVRKRRTMRKTRGQRDKVGWLCVSRWLDSVFGHAIVLISTVWPVSLLKLFLIVLLDKGSPSVCACGGLGASSWCQSTGDGPEVGCTCRCAIPGHCEAGLARSRRRNLGSGCEVWAKCVHLGEAAGGAGYCRNGGSSPAAGETGVCGQLCIHVLCTCFWMGVCGERVLSLAVGLDPGAAPAWAAAFGSC